MKRSEMVKKLSHKLICPHVILESGIENCFIPKAEYILDFLEDEGMRPPYDAFQDDGVDTMEWEPE